MRLDLLSAWRQLRRSRATSIAAVITLAIGIGATTAVFSFVTAVLSAGAPAPDMERLVALWSWNRGESETKGLVSAGDYLDWTSRTRAFESTAAASPVSFNVSGPGPAVRVGAQRVTPGYFDLLRWNTVLGRAFTSSDAMAGAPRVVLVSHTFWQNTLGARPDVLGQSLRLDGEPHTIIGVLRRIPAATGIYVPLSLTPPGDRSARTLFVYARLRDGVTIDAARAEMHTIGEALEREHAATNHGWGVNTRPLQEEFVGPQARLIFSLLLTVVFTVLLIGCVNIANLLLARGAARRGELAVRIALGAGGWRVTRQLLIECALLAFLGAALSLPVTGWTLNLLSTLGEVDSPWITNGGLNLRVLGVATLLAMAATIVTGLAPAVSARRLDVVTGLHAAGRSGRGASRRVTRTLVAAQVALAVALLIMAGLTTRTLMAIEQLEPGFDMDGVLTAAVTLPDAIGPRQAARWIDEALARTRQLPGVTAAGATSRLPFAGSRWNANRGIEIEGESPADGEGRWAVDYAITPGLLETLRVRVIEGRVFTDADGSEAPAVAIVNQAMVRRFWPGSSPLGARVRSGGESSPWRTVVGVVADIRNDDADQPPLPYLYVPLAQQPVGSVAIALRATGNPAGYAEALRQAIASFDPEQPLYDVRTMRAVWDADLRNSRILIQVMSALAVVALGLAALGVWGVSAQAVAQRTREIGVRVALGASATQVGRLVAWQGLLPIAAGLFVGLGLGLALGRLMRSILFQVSPTDPVTLLGVTGVLAAVAIASTIGPALRAARVDPLSALRSE